ncbi:MAG: hypothetical protein AAF488_17165 [Planctomycetota bacterium]
MASLKERLDRIKAGFVKKASDSIQKTIAASNQAIWDSGLLDGLPDVGSKMPSFELHDSEGRAVSSGKLLERGPLVITFYRGLW